MAAAPRPGVVRLATLNLRHGGGRRIDLLAESLLGYEAHVLVATEFRSNPEGRRLRARLAAAGYRSQASSAPPPGKNGVLVAARGALAPCPPPPGPVPEGAFRWVEVDLGGWRLAGVYLPNREPKLRFWPWLLERLRERALTPFAIMGDFNTGKHFVDEEAAGFYGEAYAWEVERLGYRDAWRFCHGDRREWTWRNPRTGYGMRLDYLHLSPRLAPALLDAWHDPAPRRERRTDHSALIVDLAP